MSFRSPWLAPDTARKHTSDPSFQGKLFQLWAEGASMAWGRNARGPAPSPVAGKACQATKIYRYWYIFSGLQVCHLAHTPAASCPCAYLTPWCRLPLGFGCRPAVPRAFHSTILLNRNSFLNHPADCVELLHTAQVACAHTRGSTAPVPIKLCPTASSASNCTLRKKPFAGQETHSKPRILETPSSGCLQFSCDQWILK